MFQTVKYTGRYFTKMFPFKLIGKNDFSYLFVHFEFFFKFPFTYFNTIF